MADLVEWLRDALDAEEQDARDDAQVCLTNCEAPALVLRTIAAHRAILADHDRALAAAKLNSGDLANAGRLLGAVRTLKLLASIYQDRPGFDPSWTVENR